MEICATRRDVLRELHDCQGVPVSEFKGTFSKELQMDKYQCDACGYIYDPEEGDPDSGIPKGTSFEELPADWVCPLCGVGKDRFSKVD